MKVKIEIVKTSYKEVDIQFPYYYKHDFKSDYDSIIYGKIEYRGGVNFIDNQIHETDLLFGKKFEIEMEEYTGLDSLSGYLTDEHKSTEKEFIEAKKRAVEFLNNI